MRASLKKLLNSFLSKRREVIRIKSLNFNSVIRINSAAILGFFAVANILNNNYSNAGIQVALGNILISLNLFHKRTLFHLASIVASLIFIYILILTS